MPGKHFNLGDVTLDESGRAILSDDVLGGVEAAFESASAGGLNGVCNGTTNGDCFNSTACRNSSNSSNCTNQTSCDGASNPRDCYGYLDQTHQ